MRKNKLFWVIVIQYTISNLCFSQILAKNTPIHSPCSPVLDNQGNFYFIESFPFSQIKKIDKEGKIFSITGPNIAPVAQLVFPEVASTVSIPNPVAMAVTNSGNIYLVDAQQWFPAILKIDKQGYIRRIVGGPYSSKIKIKYPSYIAYTLQKDRLDNIYFAVNTPENENKWTGKIYKLDFLDNITYLTAIESPIISIAIDNMDNIYIGTPSKIYKIDNDKKPVKIAGTEELGFDGDGKPANSAKINYPQSMAFDKEGNLYIADRYNLRIRKIDINGNISTVAGNGKLGFSIGNVKADSSSIGYPTGITIDRNTGTIYFTDMGFANEDIGASRIMKIENGELKTVAGGWEAVLASNSPDSYNGLLALQKIGNFYLQNNQLKEYEETVKKYLSVYKRKDQHRLFMWKSLFQILSQDKDRENQFQSTVDEFINEWKDKPDVCLRTIYEIVQSLWREPLEGKWLLKKGIETFPEEEFTQIFLKTYLLTPNMADKEEIIPLCKRFLEKYPESIFYREIEMKLIDKLMTNKKYKETEKFLKNHEKFLFDIHITLIKLARCAKNDGKTQDAVNYLVELENLPGFKGTDFEKMILEEMIEIYKTVPGNEEKIKSLEARKETLKDKEVKFKEIINSAQSKEKENDFIGAVEELERFINQFPNNETTVIHIIPKIVFYLSKWKDKESAEKKLLQLTKGEYLPFLYTRILSSVCTYYILQKNGKKAYEYLLQLWSQFPDDKDIYKLSDSVHTLLLSDIQKKEEYEKSWEIFKKLSNALYVPHFKDWCISRQIYFSRKFPSFEEKISWLIKCRDILPKNDKVYPQKEIINILTLNAKEEKDYQFLTEEYKTYIKMLEEMGRTYEVIEGSYKLGKIYEEKMLRKNLEAIKWYEKAIELMPTHPSAILAQKALSQIK